MTAVGGCCDCRSLMSFPQIDVDLAHWQKNGAGLEHSHKHGFGLIKAWRLVNAARVGTHTHMHTLSHTHVNTYTH